MSGIDGVATRISVSLTNRRRKTGGRPMEMQMSPRTHYVAAKRQRTSTLSILEVSCKPSISTHRPPGRDGPASWINISLLSVFMEGCKQPKHRSGGAPGIRGCICLRWQCCGLPTRAFCVTIYGILLILFDLNVFPFIQNKVLWYVILNCMSKESNAFSRNTLLLRPPTPIKIQLALS